MTNGFTKALSDAQELPEPPEGASHIPDLLAGNPGQNRPVRQIGTDETGKIAGAKEFNFEFFCARLTMGHAVIDHQNGHEVTEERDDSERLTVIMNKELRGEAVVVKRDNTFLKDGTVIVWIEWMEPKKAPSRIDRNYLTRDELLDPEPTKRSPSAAGSDDADTSSPDSDAMDDSVSIFQSSEEQESTAEPEVDDSADAD
jgi:hypothetical protein